MEGAVSLSASSKKKGDFPVEEIAFVPFNAFRFKTGSGQWLCFVRKAGECLTS